VPGTDFPNLDVMAVTKEHSALLHRWITDPKAVRWLDLGGGRQSMSERDLFLMITSRRNHARLFCLPDTQKPLMLICLNDVVNLMGSAEAWCVRGVYEGGPLNVAAAAGVLALANGFVDLEREVICAWVVESNEFSSAVHRKVGFKQTGRIRSRHLMNGRHLDRLLYDITRAEFADLYPDVPAESGRTMRQLPMNGLRDARATGLHAMS
jgi:RimJ/RimL family protein N-acetyltransferase